MYYDEIDLGPNCLIIDCLKTKLFQEQIISIPYYLKIYGQIAEIPFCLMTKLSHKQIV